MSAPSFYLGLDAGTQSLTGLLLEVRGERRRVVWEHTVQFDDLPYGTRHGVLPSGDPLVATSSPVMWADALDHVMATLARTRSADLARIVAISGCGQQHGSVYLNADATRLLAQLDPLSPLASQARLMLSRRDAPIWMDSSTALECAAITHALGGANALQRLTGSRAFERFTGPQIRKFAHPDHAAYEATDRIHLVSSFLASLLIGAHAPLEPGDAAGMNLMDITTRQWSERALDATAPGLRAKLPSIVPSATVIGRLAPYWTSRYGLPAAKVIAWTGDNLSSAIGVGLVDPSCLAVSLGTSDTVFGIMTEPRLDPAGAANVFGAATGAYLGLVCFKNGSLARERVRDAYGLDWGGFGKALRSRPPGNEGAIMLPWFEPEITPTVLDAGERRYGFDASDAATNVRAVVEGQVLAMARHVEWMGAKPELILSTGGAAANREVLQVMADVFAVDVCQLEVGASAALGAALRAFHADRQDAGEPVAWADVVAGIAREGTRIQPDARSAAVYAEMRLLHAACEAHALGKGPDPLAR